MQENGFATAATGTLIGVIAIVVEELDVAGALSRSRVTQRLEAFLLNNAQGNGDSERPNAVDREGDHRWSPGDTRAAICAGFQACSHRGNGCRSAAGRSNMSEAAPFGRHATQAVCPALLFDIEQTE